MTAKVFDKHTNIGFAHSPNSIIALFIFIAAGSVVDKNHS